MKAAILSNIVVDEIVSRDLKSSKSLGGPAAYCGITARKFGFDTTLFTHFGKDLDSQYLDYLKNQGISFNDPHYSDLLTTRFVLKNFETVRELLGTSIEDWENSYNLQFSVCKLLDFL